METIELKNGLKLEVDENVLDDMEFLEDLYEAQKENPLKIVVVVKKALGEENKNKLYEKIRDKKTGRVTTQAAGDALTEIFEKMSNGKNL